jgi:hypothetical protein
MLPINTTVAPFEYANVCKALKQVTNRDKIAQFYPQKAGLENTASSGAVDAATLIRKTADQSGSNMNVVSEAEEAS